MRHLFLSIVLLFAVGCESPDAKMLIQREKAHDATVQSVTAFKTWGEGANAMVQKLFETRRKLIAANRDTWFAEHDDGNGNFVAGLFNEDGTKKLDENGHQIVEPMTIEDARNAFAQWDSEFKTLAEDQQEWAIVHGELNSLADDLIALQDAALNGEISHFEYQRRVDVLISRAVSTAAAAGAAVAGAALAG
jgi:hypothetical protein